MGARRVRANFARAPKGGDTDQLKAVAAGECALTSRNQYYYARLVRSAKPDEREAAREIGVVWPNQDDRGTHVNISGAGVLKNAPHREAAVKFLEYLASDEAQRYFADGNNEWPVVEERQGRQPGARSARQVQARCAQRRGARAATSPSAQKIYDRVAWK